MRAYADTKRDVKNEIRWSPRNEAVSRENRTVELAGFVERGSKMRSAIFALVICLLVALSFTHELAPTLSDIGRFKAEVQAVANVKATINCEKVNILLDEGYGVRGQETRYICGPPHTSGWTSSRGGGSVTLCVPRGTI